MEEKVFLKEGDVTVSSSRFIVGSQTYAMSGITSVKSYKQDPDYAPAAGPILLGIAVLLIGYFFFGFLTILAGVALVALGIWIATKIKPTYSVQLNSSSGEASALADEDENWVARVVEALNNAIISRG